MVRSTEQPAAEHGDAGVLPLDAPTRDSPAPDPPTNVPAALTTFIGRREEIAAIRGLLARSRMLTLVGTGGIGKSRLAQEVARQSLRSFAGGVWLVDLAGVRDTPDAVARTIGTPLGIREQPGIPAAEAALAAIGSSRTLLVLDECEWAVGSLAAFAAELLRSCPEARVLATSRRPIGVSGEALYPVPPLTVRGSSRRLRDGAAGDAVGLFVERVRRHRPDFRLTEQTAPLVDTLCRVLDGLPLAIELAAARVRDYGLDELVARLADQSVVLDRGPLDAPERQRSLAATIDWSLAKLTDVARASVPRLAVFRGGFDRAAAAAVAALDGASIDAVLSELVDESLLNLEDTDRGRSRYRFLEPIRQHALGLLRDAGEEDEALERLARHVAGVARGAAEAVDSATETGWFDIVEADHDNVELAVAWSLAHAPAVALAIAVDLGEFCGRRGHVGELRGWLEDAIAAGRVTTPSPRTLIALAGTLAWSGDFGPAHASIRRALDGLREHPDDRTEARAWMMLGDLEAPNARPARAAFEAATAAARRAGDEGLLCETLGRWAWTEWALGDRDQAVGLASSAVAIARRLGLAGPAVGPLTVLARDAMFTFGSASAADPLLAEALALSRTARDPAAIDLCLQFLAVSAAWRGDLEAVVGSLVEAAELVRRAGARPARLTFVELVGVIAIRFGRPFEGVRLVLAKERLAGPEWLDSPPWWEYVRTETERAFSIIGQRTGDARRDALTWAVDDALAAAEREIGVLATSLRAAGPRPHAPVSSRELEVAGLIADGLTNREIGERLGISERTAEAHVRHILDKLGLSNRTQIGAWATSQRAGRMAPWQQVPALLPSPPARRSG